VFALIAIAVGLFVIVTMLGLPYQQSWYGRWGGWDR
jgi:ABC-type transport system involved in cytochrome c biogenesis permease subunit